VEIRQLASSDWQAWKSLRLSALQESPTSFGSSYEEECDMSSQKWQEWIEKEALFGAFIDDSLIGATGVRRLEGRRAAHRGTVFAVYVAPAFRRQKIASLLLQKLFAYAQSAGMTQLQIGVDTVNEAAIHFYEKIGFKVYGVMPRALIIDSTPHSIQLMFICLDGYNEEPI